jgi:hypothetical protein
MTGKKGMKWGENKHTKTKHNVSFDARMNLAVQQLAIEREWSMAQTIRHLVGKGLEAK